MLCTLFFSLLNALVYVNIDQGIHKGKSNVARNEKQKKTTWVFIFQKYGKFWSVSLEHFIKHKPYISEECSVHTQSLNSFLFIDLGQTIVQYFWPHLIKFHPKVFSSLPFSSLSQVHNNKPQLRWWMNC